MRVLIATVPETGHVTPALPVAREPEVGARVAWSGVGVHLRTRTPSPGQISDAVRSVLSDPSYRRRAEQIHDEITATGPAVTAADLVETLADTKAPVHRLASSRVPETAP